MIALARSVEMLLMDVDGVLTDGRIFWIPTPDGAPVETKAFDVTDGAGIAFARKCGIKLGVITKRRSTALGRRAEELQIQYVFNGVDDKHLALQEICQASGVTPANICYIGDDLHDLPVLTRVGFPVAVANAHAEVKARAAYVTAAFGGRGAVREVVELILKAQGKWTAVVDSFLT